MTIAVTGHRDVVRTSRLIEEIDTFFVQMLEKHPRITLLCALADGADSLVVRCALKHKHISLEVPLPFNEDAYSQTLKDKESFYALLKESSHTFVIEKLYAHPYENLGHYLVDHSDVLLALWDGTCNAKLGGTGMVVTYAKSKNHTHIHIPVTRKNN